MPTGIDPEDSPLGENKAVEQSSPVPDDSLLLNEGDSVAAAESPFYIAKNLTCPICSANLQYWQGMYFCPNDEYTESCCE